MQHHGQTVSTGKLLEEVWGYSPDDDVDTIRVHIRHLRTRLEKGERVYKNRIRWWVSVGGRRLYQRQEW